LRGNLLSACGTPALLWISVRKRWKVYRLPEYCSESLMAIPENIRDRIVNF